MVFGLFSRKTDPKVEPTPSTSIQLRTPSPSVIESSSPRVDDSCPPITPSPPPGICLVGHDDDSAEVERVGKGAGYETLWGCCGKTVDGDGDMGPPDGWCYEGMHTTDPKRARFRADSTIYEDKLTSCARLRCHEPHGSVSRKRSRRAVDADSEDSESDSGASHSSVRTRSRTSKRVRTGRAPSSDDDDDVDMVEPSTVPASPRSKSSRKTPRQIRCQICRFRRFDAGKTCDQASVDDPFLGPTLALQETCQHALSPEHLLAHRRCLVYFHHHIHIHHRNGNADYESCRYAFCKAACDKGQARDAAQVQA
ncbi:hypothetical protein B0H14DRAFT_3851293 [Mycena olivaceomarginata]|nr:hypothetical protein B0H14DRAFT_3851293 [Mycena olivaceomarginata]